jgi:hypothetical protein
MAKIIMTNGKEIDFPTVEAAEKYAAFDETTHPCDVVDEGGNIISHWKNEAAVALGSRGGKSTSDAKRKASAENGKLGGRPRTKTE